MEKPPVRGTFRAAALTVLVAVSALLASACSVPSPDPLVRRQVAPVAAVDPAQPCSREVDGGARPGEAGGAANARFDPAANTIELTGGEGVTVPALARALGDAGVLREVAPGEWQVSADIVVQPGASLRIAAPEVRWLKLESSGPRFASLTAIGGGLEVVGSCITSWDPAQNRVDTDYSDGRGYLLARDGARMAIDQAELRYLGSGEVESYGLSWRTEGTTGKITNSVVSHLYYGLYTYEVSGLEVLDNEFHDNVLYGIDPHTGSRELRIERNVVHDNGKHGIIFAEDCTDSVIRDNVVYRNKHHGIVLYLRSDRNLIEGNESFGNAAQGININESSGNTVRDNRVYDNTESGIGVGQTSHDNVVEGNQIRGNEQDGIRVVSEATRTTVRGNTIGENARYGVYVDVDGAVELGENLIFGSRAGIMLPNSAAVEPGNNKIFDNLENDVVER